LQFFLIEVRGKKKNRIIKSQLHFIFKHNT
jgi:hypothetical protein